MQQYTLLYDGSCSLCIASISWLQKRARENYFVFVDLSSSEGKKLHSTISPKIKNLDSMFLVRMSDGQSWARSTAALKATSGLQLRWRWLVFGLLIPKPLRDLCYKQIAKRRHRVLCSNECLA